MAFLFRKPPKTQMELARYVKDLTLRLSQEDKPNPKVRLCNATEDETDND